MPDDTPQEAKYARPYDFLNWYWLADDGRIWGSKKRSAIIADDPDYVAWLAYGPPTVWPRDEAGNQTDAALQAVFDGYDIKVGGVPVSQLSGDHPAKMTVHSNRPAEK